MRARASRQLDGGKKREALFPIWNIAYGSLSAQRPCIQSLGKGGFLAPRLADLSPARSTPCAARDLVGPGSFQTRVTNAGAARCGSSSRQLREAAHGLPPSSSSHAATGRNRCQPVSPGAMTARAPRVSGTGSTGPWHWRRTRLRRRKWTRCPSSWSAA